MNVNLSWLNNSRMRKKPFQDSCCLVDSPYYSPLPLDAAYGCEYMHVLSNIPESVNTYLMNKAYINDDTETIIYSSIINLITKMNVMNSLILSFRFLTNSRIVCYLILEMPITIWEGYSKKMIVYFLLTLNPLIVIPKWFGPFNISHRSLVSHWYVALEGIIPDSFFTSSMHVPLHSFHFICNSGPLLYINAIITERSYQCDKHYNRSSANRI